MCVPRVYMSVEKIHYFNFSTLQLRAKHLVLHYFTVQFGSGNGPFKPIYLTSYLKIILTKFMEHDHGF